MKYMPLMYGVWGWAFPAGLIMYWTTANAIQISQQTLMLRAGHIGPEALERRMAEQREKMAQGTPQKKGIMGWMNEKAESARNQQEVVKKPPPKAGRSQAGAEEADARTGRRPARQAAQGRQAGQPAEAQEEEALNGRIALMAAGDSRDENVDIEEQADAVADFVEELLAKMDIDAIAEPTEQGGRVYVDILDGDPEDMSLLIGRHGQTLDAIQELSRQVVGHRLDQRIKVLVDVEDYRKRRAERVVEKAQAAAEARLGQRQRAGARADGRSRAEDRPRRRRRDRGRDAPNPGARTPIDTSSSSPTERRRASRGPPLGCFT